MFFRKEDVLQELEQGADAPEKTGPARFWELIKDELATVLIVNLLFLVTCLPIVTIPPALLALHKVARKIILGEAAVSARDYLASFKEGFVRSYGAFFLVALPMGLAGFGIVFYGGHAAEYPILLAPFMLCTTGFCVATLSSTYLYGLLCGGRPLREAVKPALVLGIAKPLRAILAALCYYGAVLLAALFFPLSGLYLFLFGFSLPCVLGHFFLRNVLKQYCGD